MDDGTKEPDVDGNVEDLDLLNRLGLQPPSRKQKRWGLCCVPMSSKKAAAQLSACSSDLDFELCRIRRAERARCRILTLICLSNANRLPPLLCLGQGREDGAHKNKIGASVSDADLPLSVVQLQRIVKQHCTALHCPALCCSPPIQVIPRVLFRCHASYECGAPDVVPLLAFSSSISLSL